MEADKLDFLDETADAPEPEPQDTAPEPKAEATGADEATPPVAAEEKPGAIPIQALLDEREKRQAAERKAEEAERRWQDVQRQIAAAQQPQKRPDWFEKPDEALRHAVAPIQMELLNNKLDTSELMASQAYGAETVEAAKQAFLAEAQKDPTLHRRVIQSRHPYDEVVKWHKRQTVVSQIGDDPDAWLNAEVERRMQERLAQSSPAPANRPPISLASAPSAGKATQPVKGNAFDQAFPV